MTAPVAARVYANKEFLRRLPLFEGLPEHDLDQLCRMAHRVTFAAGDVVMREGTPADGLYVVVDGELEVVREERGTDVPLAVRGPGDVLGEMSLLERAPRSATVRALRDSELIVVRPDDFHAMLAARPQTGAIILATIAGRLRSTEALVMSREKLASLGTLAAGLAHELNNPAAAIRRAAEHLGAAVRDWQRAAVELSGLTLTDVQSGRLAWLDAAEPAPAAALGVLASGEREDEISDWLEAHGLERAWETAPALVAFGWDRARLEAFAEPFDATQLPLVLRWLAGGIAVRALFQEIDTSAGAISDIVRSVKSYAYLDQAPVQEIDLRESLESTLTMLRHRLKEGVTVVRDYAADLPHIEAYGSELNQVWTNLIDNALDSMGGSGRITIITRRSADPDLVCVRIEDTGEGIPDAIRERIFEPFYTTKQPGQGTGLGLHIVHNIVVARHRGRISVESAPGRTVFQVLLPVRMKR